MKFRSLKLSLIVIGTAVVCAVVTGCGEDSGNNSSTTSNGSDSSNTMNNNPTTSEGTSTDTSRTNKTASTPKKKIGRASAKMSDEKAGIEKDKMGYYISTEVQPAYNGGQSALEDYITNNIEYPSQAIDNNMEGTVSVRFLVDEDGNVSNVAAIGSKLGYGLEEEAVRVVSKMPKWAPGRVKGKKVKTWRTLPITYKLEES